MPADRPTSPAEADDLRRSSFAATALTTYGTNATASFLSLVNVLIVSRTLGPEGRGDVAFLITVAILSAHLAAFGVQEANANLGGSEPGQRRSLASNSLLLALLFGGAAAAVVAGLVRLFPAVGGDVRRLLLWIVLASIPALILKHYLNFLVQSGYAFTVTNAAWLVGPVTSVIFNGVLAALGMISVGTAIAGWIAGQALGVLILLAYVSRSAGFGRPSRELAGRALGFGAKSHVGRFMQLGNYRVDQWFLGSMAGSRELGLYSVAVAWAEMLHYVPGVLVMIQRPDLVRASPDAAAVLATRVFRVALLLALAAAAVLFVAAPFLCVTLMGEEFEGSIDDLRVLVLGVGGIVALELLSSALTAQRKPMLSTAVIAAAFVVTISLDLLLIPSHGGFGAAVATSVAWTAGGLAAALVFTRALPAGLGDLVPRGTELSWLWGRLRAKGRG